MTKVVIQDPHPRLDRVFEVILPPTQPYNMVSPRKAFVNKRYGERKPNAPLSEEQRAGIIQACLEGESISTVAARFSCHRHTVRNTIQRFRTHNSLSNNPHSGRPSKLNAREKRALYRYIWQNPEIPYNHLQEFLSISLGKTVCKRTILRALHQTGLKHWKSLKRIYLNKNAITQRNKYWKEWRGKEEELVQVSLKNIKV